MNKLTLTLNPSISNTTTLHRTFMDTVGRTTLNLVAINVVDELRERDLIVTYEYPSSAKYRKPLVLAGGLFVLFVFCCVVGNLDVSIGKKQKQKTV
jgi:oligosaccharyltransferase complex subunit alpha (ribophorin I)